MTFNYDLMLENAMFTLGREINYVEDYINSANYKVFKIHGSVNWGRLIVRSPFEISNLSDEDVIKMVIKYAALIRTDGVSDEYVIRSEKSQRHDKLPLFPALALPIRGKAEFVLPAGHLSRLKECIQKVSKLLVIGWRATINIF